MSLAVIRKRLAWQKPMPSMPLFCSMTSCGWPPSFEGRGAWAFGLVVGDASSAPAAPLAGIDDEKGVGLAARSSRADSRAKITCCRGAYSACWTFSSARLTALALSIWFSRSASPLRQRLFEEEGVRPLRVPHGLKKLTASQEAVLLFAGIVVQIEGLDEVLINEPGLTLAY